MRKKETIVEQLGLVKYWIKSAQQDSSEAIRALSHALSVDEDSISYYRGKVWTEVGFDSRQEAEEFSEIAQASLRNYSRYFQNSTFIQSAQIETKYPAFFLNQEEKV